MSDYYCERSYTQYSTDETERLWCSFLLLSASQLRCCLLKASGRNCTGNATMSRFLLYFTVSTRAVVISCNSESRQIKFDCYVTERYVWPLGCDCVNALGNTHLNDKSFALALNYPQHSSCVFFVSNTALENLHLSAESAAYNTRCVLWLNSQ